MGNIGNETGSIWWPLIASYGSYPFYWHYNSDMSFTAMVMFAAYVFDTKGKQWRRKVTAKKSLFK